MCLGVFGLLGMLLPVLLLLSAVRALGSHGPAGWLLAALLVAAVFTVSVWLANRTLAWWRSTKAPERVERGPRQDRPTTR